MEKNTLYAKFVYSKEDEFLVDNLELYLNENAKKIIDFFDSNLERKPLEIKIIPTKKEYDEINKKRRGVDIPKWSIGTFYDNTIEYVSLNDYQNTTHAFPKEKYGEALEYYKKTIVHEFTHYILCLYREKYNKDSPLRYLNEGIAQYLSGQRDNMEYEFNYSLDDILSNNCYPGWYLMTKYIVEEYGSDYFKELVLDNDLATKETSRLFEEAKNYYKKKVKNK